MINEGKVSSSGIKRQSISMNQANRCFVQWARAWPAKVNAARAEANFMFPQRCRSKPYKLTKLELYTHEPPRVCDSRVRSEVDILPAYFNRAGNPRLAANVPQGK